MRKSFNAILKILLLFLVQSVWAQTGEFFDDFSYSGNNDPALSQFGWHMVHGSNGPPGGANYSKNNITFHDDTTDVTNTLMHLSTTTDNNFANMRLARIETSELIYKEGTYAARVYFDDTPKQWRDGNVQAFYTINVLKYDNYPGYSECDFEYLPWDVWGGGNTSSKLYTVTWETYSNSPWVANRAYSVRQASHKGWHTLLLKIVGGERVKYYLDGTLIGNHKTSTLGDPVYPDAPMNISFINWIATNTQGSGLGSSTENRTCTMKVDWVYHAQNTDLSTIEIENIVSNFRTSGTSRKNSMDLTSVASKTEPPENFILEQNYPNPFNPSTNIKYTIPKTAHVTITVFNSLGQEIANLVNRTQQAGTYNVTVDFNTLGTNASGLYFYQLRANDLLSTKTMMLAK